MTPSSSSSPLLLSLQSKQYSGYRHSHIFSLLWYHTEEFYKKNPLALLDQTNGFSSALDNESTSSRRRRTIIIASYFYLFIHLFTQTEESWSDRPALFECASFIDGSHELSILLLLLLFRFWKSVQAAFFQMHFMSAFKKKYLPPSISSFPSTWKRKRFSDRVFRTWPSSFFLSHLSICIYLLLFYSHVIQALWDPSIKQIFI